MSINSVQQFHFTIILWAVSSFNFNAIANILLI